MTESARSVSAITLFVADQQRSKEFYESVFEIGADHEEEGTVIFKLDNLFLRLITRGEAEKELVGKVPLADPTAGATFELSMRVADSDARCAELTARGIPIAFGPIDRPWGVRHVAIRDPDGHLWVFSADIPAG